MSGPERPGGFRLSENRLLIADAAAVGLTVLAVTRIVPPDTARTILLAYATVSAVALIVMIRVRNRVRGLVDAVANAHVRVVDQAFALVPPGVTALNDELLGMGFHLVGVTDTAVAGQRDFRTWILTEPSGETWVETGDAGRPIAVVLSSTAGGRQVEAAWPGGMRIDEPELLAAPGSATLEWTLADHRARLAAERRREAQLGMTALDPNHPDGWRIRTLEDFLAREPVQRARTGGLRLRTELRNRIEPAVRLWALSTAVAVACGAILAATS